MGNGLSIKFGFLPQKLDVSAGDISLRSAYDIEESIQDVKNQTEQIHKDWLYCPLQQEKSFMSGAITTLPYSARVFGLPKTHSLTHENADSVEHLDFLVWSIGFFLGIRLTTAEAGFLDATPIKAGKLTDFTLTGCTVEDVIRITESFWQKHSSSPKIFKRMIGAIHALFLAQYPKYLDFERFNYLYAALDACYKSVSELKAVQARSHAQRIECMCNIFNIPIPDWAMIPKQKNGSELSDVRNDAFHEALFFDEPLGFAIYGGNSRSNTSNVPHEMENLVSRIIVAIITDGYFGNSYVQSKVNTRNTFGLKLK